MNGRTHDIELLAELYKNFVTIKPEREKSEIEYEPILFDKEIRLNSEK